MKAYMLYDENDLRLENTDCPKLDQGELLIEVKAAGICGSDIPRIFDGGAHLYPLIPGHEFSGTVAAISDNAQKSWLNKSVGIFPLIPCKECELCRNGRYELCRTYNYLGSRTAGGFAEYVAVPEWNVIELPKLVTFEAAAMLEPMAVAVHAMRSIQPQKDESVAIYGLGTIGLLLAMFLKDAGIHRLFVVGNKDYQKNVVLNMGIPKENICNCGKQDAVKWLREKTNGRGVDVSFECVGKNETISNVLEFMAPGGRIQLIGNPDSDMIYERNTYWKILRNQITLKGSWNSSFTHNEHDDWHYVLDRLENRGVDPEQCITHKFPFEKLENGLQIMRNKSEEYVKIMVIRE